ncbi:transposase [Endozoicomonas gorgoniicola]|uniref:Transposase n=1 Tax=Endozoicomonas gorgoniicola TaxID=1234144 RepID=A0ABT3MXF3_9GAMM|nr:transposase [Endozoicomonas gorgoniicola]MCW7554035.1 transposase [Endozoicomonas gorgoniicola]
MNTITTPDSPTFESLQLEIIQLKTKLAWYEEQFRLYQHKKFGSSSERFEDQGLLFNEAEELAEEATEAAIPADHLAPCKTKPAA